MINKVNPQTDQKQISSYLRTIQKEKGLETALDALFDWSIEADYINREKLEENGLSCFYSLDYDLSFSYQINYARAKYNSRATGNLPPGAECLICRENGSSEGKENLRVFDITLQDRDDFFLQLSPFPLFPRHFVLINRNHIPMSMDEDSIRQSLSFISQAPSYTLCSNSDLPWAGASILSHSHFQVIKGISLPVMSSSVLESFDSPAGLTIETLRYPLPSIRITGRDNKLIGREGSRIIDAWKQTSPGKRTVNMVLFRKGRESVCILLLRDSDCRNPEALQKYKSEGIGVVEAAGSWIFPPPADYPEEELIQGSRKIIEGFFKGLSPFEPHKITGYDFLPYKRKHQNEPK